MPLMQGDTDYAKSTNIRREMDAGKPQDQAVAIAMETARRTKRAFGGKALPYQSKMPLPEDIIQTPATDDESLPPPATRSKHAEGGVGMPKLGVRPALARPHLHTGPIHSAVAGRTDHLPMHVPNKAYVLPADIVSGMGQGNTVAGFKIAKNLPDIFHRMLYGQGTRLPYKGAPAAPYGHAPPGKATGGSADHASSDHTGDVEGVPIVAAGGEHVYAPEEIAKIGNGDIDLGHDVLDAFVKHYRAEHIKTLQKLPGPKRD